MVHEEHAEYPHDFPGEMGNPATQAFLLADYSLTLTAACACTWAPNVLAGRFSLAASTWLAVPQQEGQGAATQLMVAGVRCGCTADLLHRALDLPHASPPS
jgi:hypothetical protein